MKKQAIKMTQRRKFHFLKGLGIESRTILMRTADKAFLVFYNAEKW